MASSTFNVATPTNGIRLFTATTVFAPGNLDESQLTAQAYGFPAATTTTHVSPPTQQFANTRLLELALPTFSGDPLDWLTF